ncbi:MAG TPA: shikimate dehydrogenase [Polyangiales bacterium]
MTDVYGIFGWPVGHSRSPAMHNAAFAALGLPAVYVPFAVHPDKLADAVRGVRALGLRGLNITLPHKTNIMPLLDHVEPDAHAIGAVNTIYVEGERLCGTNTDAEGLARALREAGVVLAGARVTLLGAGGAARASVVGLARAGARSITVAARRSSEAQALVAALAANLQTTALRATASDSTTLRAELAQTDLLVQATSATLDDAPGAEAFAAALPLSALPRAAVVTDLVYRPLETAVLRHARREGLTTVDGLGMLLHQGALAFERWTGRPAPLAVMRRALQS